MGTVDKEPADLDATRAAIAARDLVATASGYLTADVATRLPFESLAGFKNLLKRFFSSAPWTEEDSAALADLVAGHIGPEWWRHDLGSGIELAHGMRDGRYRLWVTGGSEARTSIFDRAFDGPVVPEATPHPRKVKFVFGGTPSPGRWHRRGDAEPPRDPRARRLLAEPDVTDVMIAGDFVTVGLAGRAPWERRLEPMLALVTELFAGNGLASGAPDRTREELLQEAGHLNVATSAAELHLLDPNDPAHRDRLTAALEAGDARIRRIAVAILAESDDPAARRSAVERGYADDARIVRRTAVDAAADAEDPSLRAFFEAALEDGDDWIRWRAVKALGDIGTAESRDRISALTDDPEFRVRFEAARVLRDRREHP